MAEKAPKTEERISGEDYQRAIDIGKLLIEREAAIPRGSSRSDAWGPSPREEARHSVSPEDLANLERVDAMLQEAHTVNAAMDVLENGGDTDIYGRRHEDKSTEAIPSAHLNNRQMQIINGVAVVSREVTGGDSLATRKTLKGDFVDKPFAPQHQEKALAAIESLAKKQQIRYDQERHKRSRDERIRIAKETIGRSGMKVPRVVQKPSDVLAA